MEDEIFYKFIINQYIDLFNKSIYDKKKDICNKNELLFMKINQDIQFFQNFNVDSKSALKSKTKSDLNNIIKNEKILNLISGFVNESKILIEIKNALIEFEEKINEKILIKRKKII